MFIRNNRVVVVGKYPSGQITRVLRNDVQPKFKPLEFEGFRKNKKGLNRFVLTSKKWIETTYATGFFFAIFEKLIAFRLIFMLFLIQLQYKIAVTLL